MIDYVRIPAPDTVTMAEFNRSSKWDLRQNIED
jgi:hypothetical protein